RARARGLRARARRGAARGLRRDAAPLGAAARREPRAGGAPGRRRARARVAAVPARRPERLRGRLHLDLPGALHPAGPSVQTLAKELAGVGHPRAHVEQVVLLAAVGGLQDHVEAAAVAGAPLGLAQQGPRHAATALALVDDYV